MILVIVTIIILNELIKKFSKFKPLAIFRSLFKLNKYSREAQVIRWHSHRFHLEDHHWLTFGNTGGEQTEASAARALLEAGRRPLPPHQRCHVNPTTMWYSATVTSPPHQCETHAYSAISRLKLSQNRNGEHELLTQLGPMMSMLAQQRSHVNWLTHDDVRPQSRLKLSSPKMRTQLRKT